MATRGRGRGGGRGGRGGRGGGGGMGGGREPPKVFGNGRFPQPNAQVTKLESDMVKGGLSSKMAASSLDIVLPSRPAYGIAGRPIVLYTNFFELKGTKADTHLHRYSLSFGDGKVSKVRKKRLIELLLAMPPFSEVKVASDWSQKLVSMEKLSLDKAYTVIWYPQGGEPFAVYTADEDSRLTTSRRKHTYQIKVEDLGTVSLADLLRDVSEPTFKYPLKLEAIDALNIVMTYGPSTQLSITAASGNTFYPFGSHPQAQSTELGGALQAYRGYFTSVRTSVSRLLVNVNVATGAFYKSGPLIDLITQVCGRQAANKDEHGRVASFVKRIKIETNYTKDRNNRNKENVGTVRKVHSIFGLSHYGGNSTNVTFKNVVNSQVSYPTVQQYFMEKHNITLSRLLAPLVNYGSSDDPKWLPVELCKVVPGQLVRHLLSPQQTSAMITFAARRPYANAESITGNGLEVAMINPVVNGQNINLSAFGIKIDPSMLTVPGRILAPPVVQYRATTTASPSNGTWNLNIDKLCREPFRVARRLNAWDTLIINSGNYDTIPGGTAMQTLDSFSEEMMKYGLNPGKVEKPCTVNVADVLLRFPPADAVAVIQQIILAGIKRSFRQKPKFLLVLLPNQNALLYDSIKTLLDCELGVPSQFCVGSKFAKTSDQYFANVAMKINQKLGGVNHTVDIKRMAPLDAHTIIFGVDVTHPSPGSAETAPSIAGVVASIDAMFSQYPASMRCQEGRKEIVVELEAMIVERLQLWQRRNQRRLPQKVIVYRDGVGESQYSAVIEVEGAAFKSAFDRLYGPASKHPKISIIMVGKRHHTRFYPTSLGDTDGSTGNPKPGTVVDRGVTGEKLFDFFLLAHQGLQGTSRPAHYVVLKDENRLGADQLQNLTHNLCYTFARATRAVSICPPAYYADILCERGRAYLHSVLKGQGTVEFSANAWSGVNPALAETMYYL